MTRRNALLVSAAVFPGLMLVGFSVYGFLLRKHIPPPAHDLLYTVFEHRPGAGPSPVQLEFVVREGRLEARARRTASPPAQGLVAQRLVLYRWRHDNRRPERIDIDMPELFDDGEAINDTELSIPEVAQLRLSPQRQAPDGYRFTSAHRSGIGLIGALYYRADRNRPRVEKDGVSYPLHPEGDEVNVWSLQFLGWIVDDG